MRAFLQTKNRRVSLSLLVQSPSPLGTLRVKLRGSRTTRREPVQVAETAVPGCQRTSEKALCPARNQFRDHVGSHPLLANKGTSPDYSVSFLTDGRGGPDFYPAATG